MRYTNKELWEIVNNDIVIGSLFSDQKGNTIIWNGNQFKIHHTKKFGDNYTGICKGDLWEYIGVYTAEESIICWNNECKYNNLDFCKCKKYPSEKLSPYKPTNEYDIECVGYERRNDTYGEFEKLLNLNGEGE